MLNVRNNGSSDWNKGSGRFSERDEISCAQSQEKEQIGAAIKSR